MDTPDINLDMLHALIKIRDNLLFELADEIAPPAEYAQPLWQAYWSLAEGIEAMKRAIGFEEPEGDAACIIRRPGES